MSRRVTDSSRAGIGSLQAAQPFSGLPPPSTVPLDQLQQIQKRLQALVLSTGQLQMEVAMAPTLDWPTILSRFGTLVSQTYSLSSSLTSSSSAFLPAQLDELQRTLEEQAKQDNYFLHEDGDEAIAGETEAEGSISRVRYTDPRNTLPRLVAVPVTPLEASADKVGRLGEALRTKLDPEVAQSHSEAAQQDEQTRAVIPPEVTQGGFGEQEETGDAQLRQVLETLQDHDHLARRALRAWHHVRWRPDEDGQAYDFRMRLGDQDAGEVDADDEADEQVQGWGDSNGQQGGGVGGSDGEDVAGEEGEDADGDEGAQAEQEEFDEEDDDEEMEDIDVS